jgi:hypothetical protein
VGRSWWTCANWPTATQPSSTYITEDALRAMEVRDGPLAGLEEAMEAYEPRRGCWSLFDSLRRWVATV